jgi:hypothetical protein
MKKPRPLSAGFHHHPVSGWFARGAAPIPLVTMLKRSMATVPPGHTIVPVLAVSNASVKGPTDCAGVGAR